MSRLKVHLIIIGIILIFALITRANIKPDDEFAAMNWFPVFVITGAYLGVVFATTLLPRLVHQTTSALFGSNAEIEHSPLHDARAAVARGDYEESIEIFQAIYTKDPTNHEAWLAQAMIYQKNLEQPKSAMQTYQRALQSHDWKDDQKAFFMSRMADIQLNELDTPTEAASLFQEIIDLFPNTRHSANAMHQLNSLN